MLVGFTLWTICSALYDRDGNKQAGRAVIGMMILHGSFYNIAWSGLLYSYSVEILPFKVRAKGIMILTLAVQGAAVFNQYVNPIGLAHLYPHWKFYIIYCVSQSFRFHPGKYCHCSHVSHQIWIAFELIVVFFAYVETRGPTLEEIAKLFDGDDAAVGGLDMETVTAISAAGRKEDKLDLVHDEAAEVILTKI
jgi:hypothetical protein